MEISLKSENPTAQGWKVYAFYNCYLIPLLSLKSLLQLMEFNGSADPAQLANLIGEARECLTFVRSNPVPEPTPNSPARRAFDPTITRRLNTAVPACRVAEPSMEQAWEALAALLDDLYDLSCLKRTRSFISWEVKPLPTG